MAMIDLREVSRRYLLGSNEVHALRGVSLRIEAGEYVAIIGQSGSGKSTLMNVLGCLDTPSSGQFLIDGEDAAGLGPDELAALRRQRFGFIFQRYHLLPHLDARANAALPAVYAGVPGAARLQRAESLLGRLGLGERMHHKPNELSGGQQQRVSIARSLMNGGQIILADEPTGALDSQSGVEMLALLSELHAQGHTIILVTHDAKVAGHAKRVIELRDGEVLRDSGTPPGHRLPAPGATEQGGPALQSGGWWQQRQGQWREALQSAALSLKGNRLRTALSMLGISIGIAAVVSIMALTTAARSSIEKDVGSFLSGRIPVWRGNPNLPPGTQPQPFRPNEIDAIRALPGVKAVTTEREVQLTARHSARDAMVSVLGADANTLASRKLKLAEGRLISAMDLSSSAQVALIDDKARKALFKPGETAVGKTLLLAPGGGADVQAAQAQPGVELPAGVALPVTIVGVVEPDTGGAVQFGAPLGQVLVPVTTFSRKLDLRVDADQFNVLLDFTVPPDAVRKQIHFRLKALHGVEDFDSWNADEEFKRIQSVTSAMALLFAGVGAISLLVGGVGVMNIMLVSVSERTREIGIRMAVGARQADVRLQFMVEAVVLCCLGGLVGVGLSWLAATALNAFQDELTVQVDGTALAVAFGVSTLVGLIFGTLPARRAAALSPVDALARE